MGAKDIKQLLAEHEYLTINEVARRLTYHPKHVRKLCASGELKSKKIKGKRVIPLLAFLEFCETASE